MLIMRIWNNMRLSIFPGSESPPTKAGGSGLRLKAGLIGQREDDRRFTTVKTIIWLPWLLIPDVFLPYLIGGITSVRDPVKP